MNKFKITLFIVLGILAFSLGIYLTSRYAFISDSVSSSKTEKDNIWQILNWKFTIFFGLAASLLALFQAIFSTTQKYKELRWKKAELAMKLIDELYDVELAHNALKMTDEMNTTYSKELFVIKIEDISKAFKDLNNREKIDNSVKSVYIRNCFDTLFYYFERIEHSLNIGVVDFADIKSFFAYYMDVIKKHKRLLVGYCNFIKYSEAICFIERFA